MPFLVGGWGVVELGGKGRDKNHTSVRHLERVHMAHGCDLG